MENIGERWKTSESLIQEYSQQQAKLRAKQKMLKEDYERFKAQREEYEKKKMARSREASVER